MKTVLVTGGAGFIGSHVTLLLLEEGFEVIVFDSFINSSNKVFMSILKILKKSNPLFQKNLFVHEGDLRNKKSVEDLFKKYIQGKKSIDCVIHLAGLKDIADSFIRPFEYWETNFIGSLNLLKVMDLYDCKRIVFSSSASVYEPNLKNLISEKCELEPNTPYGKTKLSIEYLISDICENSKNWKSMILRYFNPIGAHCSGIIGEASLNNPCNIFPLILNVASGKIKYLNIYGDNWDTLDGTTVRDYLHVSDLALGHFQAMNYLFVDCDKNVNYLNLGLGHGTSIIELINTFEKVTSIKIPYIFKSRRIGDVAVRIADPKLAQEIINWKPTKNIEDMCLDGWRWKKNNPNGY